MALTPQPWTQHSFVFPNTLHVSSKSQSCRAIPGTTSIGLGCAESEAEERSGAAAVQQRSGSFRRRSSRRLHLPRAPLTPGNSQIQPFPLLPGSVFPDCCSALNACLVLDVPPPHGGEIIAAFHHVRILLTPLFQISRSWYKPDHFQKLFNRCLTCRRHLE